MRMHTAAEIGIFGQIRDTKPRMGQMGVPGELWLFPGHIVKIWECPGKSETDGHLGQCGQEVIRHCSQQSHSDMV